MRIEALREQIDRSDYHVDPGKVAEAILDRATGRIWLVPASARSVREQNKRGAASRAPAA